MSRLLQVERLDQTIQVVRMEAETPGRLGVVSVTLFERLRPELSLEIFDDFMKLGARRGRDYPAFDDRLWEILGNDLVNCPQNNGTLNRVVKLARIAGPIVVGQTGHRFG